MSEGENAETLAEAAARREAAHSQWQKALARARDRFRPANLRDEAIEHAAEAIGNAADEAARLAVRHKGKLALGGSLIALVAARKPLWSWLKPQVARVRTKIDTLRDKASD